MSDSNQNVETTCNSKLMFTELKRFIHQKGAAKLVKDEFWATLKFQISAEDIDSDYEFLLLLVNTFTVETEGFKR